MQSIVRGLVWPVVSLIVIGSTHLAAELIRPDLHDVIGPAVVMPIYLVAGGLAAWATLTSGGTVLHGFAAAALLGLLPVGLQLVGFGVILGRDSETVTAAAMFGWLGVLWGGALGIGLRASRPDQAA